MKDLWEGKEEKKGGRGARRREIKSLSAFHGRIISSSGKGSGRQREERRGGVRFYLSPGSQSKDSKHIFSSLASGPALPLAVVESPSRAVIFLLSPSTLSSVFLSHIHIHTYTHSLPLSPSFALSAVFSISSTCSPRSPRSKHADASSLVRGVSSEMKGGNRRLQERSGGTRGKGEMGQERWPYNIH